MLTEDDQVLGDTGVDDVHGTHGTAGVVEYPLLLSAQVLGADLLLQLGNNEVDDGVGVLAVGADGALRHIVQVLWVKDVELLQARVEVAVDGGEQSQEDGQEAQGLQGEAATAAAGAGGLGGFGRHLVDCGRVLEWRKMAIRALKFRGLLIPPPPLLIPPPPCLTFLAATLSASRIRNFYSAEGRPPPNSGFPSKSTGFSAH
jgi:hypothetical protein